MTRDLNGVKRLPLKSDLSGWSLACSFILAAVLVYLFGGFWKEYNEALLAVLMSGLLLPASRPLLSSLGWGRRNGEGVAILGTGKLAEKVYQELAKSSDCHFYFIGTNDGGASNGDGHRPVPVSRLKELVQGREIARVVIAEEKAEDWQKVAQALLECKLRGLEIEHPVDSYERLNHKIWLEALPPDWLVYSTGFSPSRAYLFVKRVVDIAGAVALMLLCAPVMLLAAIAIKLESRGPVLFQQPRVGLNGMEFILYKFRSMREDAELATGPVWAAERDPRITRIGALLRKFRVDELPQAINVLRGEMSLVGPRPERRYFIDLLKKHIPYYDLRHSVKPGMTGWAQVMYNYGASIEDAYEKLQYELYYAKHMSLRLEMKILLKTVRVVLFGRGR